MPQFLPGPGTRVGLQEHLVTPDAVLAVPSGPASRQNAHRSRVAYYAARNRRTPVVAFAPFSATPTVVRPAAIVIHKANRRSVRARTHHQARISRAPVVVLQAVRPRAVIKPNRAPRPHRHHQARISRAPFFAVVRPTIIVHKPNRGPIRVRRTHHQARIIRPTVFPLLGYVRPTIVTHTRRRSPQFFRRHTPTILSGGLGVAVVYRRPTIIVVPQRRSPKHRVRHIPVQIAGVGFTTILGRQKQPVLGRNNRKSGVVRAHRQGFRHQRSAPNYFIPPVIPPTTYPRVIYISRPGVY